MSERVILGIDTTGAHVSVALCHGADVLAQSHEEMSRGQAEALFVRIDRVLGEAGGDYSDLTRIGVGIGPGNFTGARICVAAALGLSRSLGVPALGINAMETAVFGHSEPILGCQAAPKDKAYVQGFGLGPYATPQLIEIEQLGQNPDWICAGTAAEAVASKVGGTPVQTKFAPGVAIAMLAATREPNGPPKPLYLRQADAAPSRVQAPRILA